MPLADCYRHWQQAPDDELLDYDPTATEPVPDTMPVVRVTWEHIPWRNADEEAEQLWNARDGGTMTLPCEGMSA